MAEEGDDCICIYRIWGFTWIEGLLEKEKEKEMVFAVLSEGKIKMGKIMMKGRLAPPPDLHRHA